MIFSQILNCSVFKNPLAKFWFLMFENVMIGVQNSILYIYVCECCLLKIVPVEFLWMIVKTSWRFGVLAKILFSIAEMTHFFFVKLTLYFRTAFCEINLIQLFCYLHLQNCLLLYCIIAFKSLVYWTYSILLYYVCIIL